MSSKAHLNWYTWHMQKYIWTIIIIGLIVFSPTVFNGFVMDDQGLILNNANVHSIGNLFNFFRGSIFDYGEMLELMRRGGEPETAEEADDFFISDEEDIDPYAAMAATSLKSTKTVGKSLSLNRSRLLKRPLS